MNSLKRRLRFHAGATYDIYIGKGFSGIVKSHNHDFFQIMYVYKGHVTQLQNGQTIEQYPGDVFFTPRGIDHALTIHEPDTRYYCLSFSQNIATDIMAAISADALQNLLPDPVIHLSEAEQATVTELCELLLKEQNQAKSVNLDAGIYLTEAIAVMLLRIKFKSIQTDRPFRRGATESVKRAVEYINENYVHDIDIEELCRESGMSKSGMYNAFPKIMGITIQKYITEVRIHEAIRLSYRSNLSWNEISRKVGYNDFSTFYRNFVKVTGTSPTEYLENSAILFDPTIHQTDI